MNLIFTTRRTLKKIEEKNLVISSTLINTYKKNNLDDKLFLNTYLEDFINSASFILWNNKYVESILSCNSLLVFYQLTLRKKKSAQSFLPHLFISALLTSVMIEWYFRVTQGYGVGRFFRIRTSTPDSDSSCFETPTPTPAVLKNRLRLPTPAVLKNRLRLPQVLHADCSIK